MADELKIAVRKLFLGTIIVHDLPYTPVTSSQIFASGVILFLEPWRMIFFHVTIECIGMFCKKLPPLQNKYGLYLRI